MEQDRITQDYLRSLLSYCEVSGKFTWKRRKALPDANPAKIASWNTRYAGKDAGVMTHGYIRITIDDAKYYAHRLAFLYVTGMWPDHLIDHINGNGLDNRWCNLRQATKKTNADNPNNKKRQNSCGYTGVVSHSNGRFVAQCGARRRYGMSAYLGIYETAESAHAAYLKARSELPR